MACTGGWVEEHRFESWPGLLFCVFVLIWCLSPTKQGRGGGGGGSEVYALSFCAIKTTDKITDNPAPQLTKYMERIT